MTKANTTDNGNDAAMFSQMGKSGVLEKLYGWDTSIWTTKLRNSIRVGDGGIEDYGVTIRRVDNCVLVDMTIELLARWAEDVTVTKPKVYKKDGRRKENKNDKRVVEIKQYSNTKLRKFLSDVLNTDLSCDVWQMLKVAAAKTLWAEYKDAIEGSALVRYIAQTRERLYLYDEPHLETLATPDEVFSFDDLQLDESVGFRVHGPRLSDTEIARRKRNYEALASTIAKLDVWDTYFVHHRVLERQRSGTWAMAADLDVPNFQLVNITSADVERLCVMAYLYVSLTKGSLKQAIKNQTGRTPKRNALTADGIARWFYKIDDLLTTTVALPTPLMMTGEASDRRLSEILLRHEFPYELFIFYLKETFDGELPKRRWFADTLGFNKLKTRTYTHEDLTRTFMAMLVSDDISNRLRLKRDLSLLGIVPKNTDPDEAAVAFDKLPIYKRAVALANYTVDASVGERAIATANVSELADKLHTQARLKLLQAQSATQRAQELRDAATATEIARQQQRRQAQAEIENSETFSKIVAENKALRKQVSVLTLDRDKYQNRLRRVSPTATTTTYRSEAFVAECAAERELASDTDAMTMQAIALVERMAKTNANDAQYKALLDAIAQVDPSIIAVHQQAY